MTGEPPGLPEFLAVLRRSRILFLTTLALSLVIGVLVALALPARYRAVAILLPPDDRGLPPLTRTERESLAVNPGGPAPLEVLETPAGLAARLLRAAPVLEAAAELLAPAGGWKDEAARAATRDRLARGLRAAVTDEKIVVVEMEADSAAWAARAADAMGEALNSYNLRRRSALATALAGALQAEIAATGAEMERLAAELGRGSPEEMALGSGGEAAAARRLVALRGELASLGSELGRARKDQVDPRPAIEFVERAAVPVRPARPVRAAVVALFLFAGALGGVAGAFVKEAFMARGPR